MLHITTAFEALPYEQVSEHVGKNNYRGAVGLW